MTRSAQRIFNEIEAILKDNGDITQKTKDRLILAALGEVFNLILPLTELDQRVGKIEHDISDLKDINAWLWIKGHPKTTALAGATFFIILNLWFISEFRQAALALLGLPDFIP